MQLRAPYASACTPCKSMRAAQALLNLCCERLLVDALDQLLLIIVVEVQCTQAERQGLTVALAEAEHNEGVIAARHGHNHELEDVTARTLQGHKTTARLQHLASKCPSA